jgi:hypothetical protein
MTLLEALIGVKPPMPISYSGNPIGAAKHSRAATGVSRLYRGDAEAAGSAGDVVGLGGLFQGRFPRWSQQQIDYRNERSVTA